jgi:hypothetical protein
MSEGDDRSTELEVPAGSTMQTMQKDREPADLADRHIRAVDLIVSGLKPSAVARELGVSRETLWRWRQLPAFRGQLERLRLELHRARVDRIWALVDKSYDVVEDHLDEGDPQVAMGLLRLAGGRLTAEAASPQDAAGEQ